MATRGKSPIILAYTAAIVDGEGSIVIERSSEKVDDSERRLTPRYILKVGVVNTSKALMDFLQKEFGGRVRPRKMGLAHHRQVYGWLLNTRQAESFLKEIEPYMLIKRRQAIIALHFMALPMEYEQGENNRWRVSAEIIAKREHLYQRLKKENDFRGHPQRLSEEASRTDEATV